MKVIYAIRNECTGQEYIGQTRQSLKRRLQAHIDNRTHVGLAIRRDGVGNFTIRELCACTDDNADAREREWIKMLSTMYPTGYNRQEGGSNKFSCPESVKTALRGRVVSDETKRKLSESLSGRSITPRQLEALENGRHLPKNMKGERNGRALLTTQQVMDIRQRYCRGGISQQLLADEYHVHQCTISAIVRHKTWP